MASGLRWAAAPWVDSLQPMGASPPSRSFWGEGSRPHPAQPLPHEGPSEGAPLGRSISKAWPLERSWGSSEHSYQLVYVGISFWPDESPSLCEGRAVRGEVQFESQGRLGSRGSRLGTALALRRVVADLGWQES